jgi:hypothetical protein
MQSERVGEKLILAKDWSIRLRKCFHECYICPSHQIFKVALIFHRKYLVKHTAAESLLVKASEAVVLAQ